MSPCRFRSTGPSCWMSLPPTELIRETQSDFMGLFFPSVLDSWSIMELLTKNLWCLTFVAWDDGGCLISFVYGEYFLPFPSSPALKSIMKLATLYSNYLSAAIALVTLPSVHYRPLPTRKHPLTHTCMNKHRRALTFHLTARGSIFRRPCTFPRCSICIA